MLMWNHDFLSNVCIKIKEILILSEDTLKMTNYLLSLAPFVNHNYFLKSLKTHLNEKFELVGLIQYLF